jgi:hypothetical protein
MACTMACRCVAQIIRQGGVYFWLWLRQVGSAQRPAGVLAGQCRLGQHLRGEGQIQQLLAQHNKSDRGREVLEGLHHSLQVCGQDSEDLVCVWETGGGVGLGFRVFLGEGRAGRGGGMEGWVGG